MRGENMTGAHADRPAYRYRICVRGRLGETIRSAFPALQARASGGDTGLTPSPRATDHPVLSQCRPSWCQPQVPAPHSPPAGTVQLVSSTAATTPMAWYARPDASLAGTG